MKHQLMLRKLCYSGRLQSISDIGSSAFDVQAFTAVLITVVHACTLPCNVYPTPHPKLFACVHAVPGQTLFPARLLYAVQAGQLQVACIFHLSPALFIKLGCSRSHEIPRRRRFGGSCCSHRPCELAVLSPEPGSELPRFKQRSELVICKDALQQAVRQYQVTCQVN